MVGGNTTSFYVSNLPSSCTVGMLWKEFQVCGKMTDAYLAKRKDKSGKYFTFIRFEGVKDKEKMVKALRQMSIGESKVLVNVAKFVKEEAPKRQQLNRSVYQPNSWKVPPLNKVAWRQKEPEVFPGLIDSHVQEKQPGKSVLKTPSKEYQANRS
ncbi:putative RNA recognition motif domain, nucleotide-binding alpha-beta plait domain superfamily [Helianthus annuus]|nr:putative RNA recognition motif domain, nucleotide-binding alpha-beta plait domain superfamily [Helianthus annuus]